MTEIYIQALQLSLSIVADIRDGESVDGIDEDGLLMSSVVPSKDPTPLNVNTGAIGANGTFSSVARKNGKESKSRLSMQRIVVCDTNLLGCLDFHLRKVLTFSLSANRSEHGS
jgi:hypothetical protein